MLDAIRTIFISIDSIVYKFVEVILQTIIDLSNVEIFAESVISEFASRIYVILGLVMLFKIMISFIQILIEPDAMNDKEKGVGNVLKRVVFSLVLIFLVPSIFDLGRQVQNYVVPIIPKVVLGVNSDLSSVHGSEALSSVGRTMAWYSFLPFFTYNNDSCNQGELLGTGTDNAGNNTSGTVIATVGQATGVVNDKCPTSNDNRGYKYNYSFPLSTIVGAYLIFVLVQIAVKIAIRSIKLGLCEIIAPIPIASYIDPKTSKQAFDNWVSTSVKTYLDLFIRLVVVYFAIFVFDVVFEPSNIQVIYAKIGGSIFRGTMITLFIIVGLLQFVKDAPKFVMDMLGVKGGGDIASMFKGQGWKELGNSIGGAAGMLANPFSSALSNYNYAKKVKGESAFRAAMRGIGGFAAGATRSTGAAFSGKGWKGAFTDARSATTANSMRRVNTRKLRLEDKQRYLDEKQKAKTIQSRAKTIQSRLDMFENNMNAIEQQYREAERVGDSFAMNNLYNQREKLIAEQKELEKQLLQAQQGMSKLPAGSIRSRAKDAWNDFSGTPIATSKTYHSAASLMDSGKSKIFNAAKSKVVEKPDLIKEQLNFTGPTGEKFTASFAEIFDAHQAISSGRAVAENSKFAKFSGAVLETMYGNALKDAASNYIDNVFANKDKNFKNEPMRQDILQWKMKFDNDTVIDASDRNMINSKLKSGDKYTYGNFFKSSDDLGAQFETKAMSMEKTELAKKGDGN